MTPTLLSPIIPSSSLRLAAGVSPLVSDEGVLLGDENQPNQDPFSPVSAGASDSGDMDGTTGFWLAVKLSTIID